jgi:hypothetical protein
MIKGVSLILIGTSPNIYIYILRKKNSKLGAMPQAQGRTN